MRLVPPRRPWQVPLGSDTLVASALAHARPLALASRDSRLDGASDAVVAEEYRSLRDRVWGLAQRDEAVLTRMERLEQAEPLGSWPPWQTAVWKLEADEDESVIEAALDVWDALGPNAYGLVFGHRPRTGKGFVEGRLWLLLYVLGAVALVFAGVGADDRYGVPWWLSLPLVAAWTALVGMSFRSTYRRRARVAGEELPYP